MIADVSLILGTNYSSIVIPFYLLQQSLNSYYIYLEREGRAVKKEIQISEIQGDMVKVSSGLELGDKIIIDGYKYVEDGSQVMVN
jgi:hypothetical protein